MGSSLSRILFAYFWARVVLSPFYQSHAKGKETCGFKGPLIYLPGRIEGNKRDPSINYVGFLSSQAQTREMILSRVLLSKIPSVLSASIPFLLFPLLGYS